MLISFRCVWRAGLLMLCFFTGSLGAQTDAVTRRAAIDQMLYPVMLAEMEAKNFGRARNICEQAIMWEPQNPVHHYNLACIEAQAGGPRIPYAWGALELAIALGFNDVNHLQTDPDLKPLRSDLKFADLVQKVAFRASVGDAVASTKTPEDRTGSQLDSTPGEIEEPAGASFEDGLPVGLFLMSRYVPSTQANETSVWYFAPDRRVYRDLEYGFSRADLKSHAGLQGKVGRTSQLMEVSWLDGTKSASTVERDGLGFSWDMGIFVPVTAFENASDAVGVYEGYESVGTGTNDLPVAQRLELRIDGTFNWDGVSVRPTKEGQAATSIGSKETTSGRWELAAHSLLLTTNNGATLRRIAFPQDDERTVIRPDRMFFGGLMYKRRP